MIMSRVKRGSQWFRYCHAGEQGKPCAGGVPVPVSGHHDTLPLAESDASLLATGWETDGRLWFCPTCVDTPTAPHPTDDRRYRDEPRADGREQCEQLDEPPASGAAADDPTKG